jgi:hypothetical protein
MKVQQMAALFRDFLKEVRKLPGSESDALAQFQEDSVGLTPEEWAEELQSILEMYGNPLEIDLADKSFRLQINMEETDDGQERQFNLVVIDEDEQYPHTATRLRELIEQASK